MIREIRTFYVKHLVKNLPPTLDEIKKVLLSQRQQNSSGTSIMKLC